MPSDQNNNNHPDQYDFIMNPQQAPRPPIFTGTSTLQRVIILVAGLLFLIIIFVIVNSFLSSSGNAQQDKLLAVAKTQTEIVRITESASEKISDKDLLNQSINVRASLSSSKNKVIAALEKRGQKLKDKDLASSDTAANDAALTEGEQNNRFDETYKQLLEKQLADYQAELESAYESGNSTEKEIMTQSNSQINLLLGKKQ